MAHIADPNLVSVILPVYNAAPYLEEAIASVRAQTYKRWEVIAALDPGSSDESEDILVHSPGVKLVRPHRRGVSAARNAALERARGRWIAFLDADDFWLPKKLERQIASMSDYSFSATSFRRVDVGGTRVGRKLSPPSRLDHVRLLGQNSLCCSSVMLDRQRVPDPWFEDVGCEDYALWLKLTREGHVGIGLEEDLVRYRIVPNSRGSSKWRTARESWALLRRYGNARAFPAFLGRGFIKHARF